MIPPLYDHPPTPHGFFTNISGFYRDARLHPLSLVQSPSSSSSAIHSHFFDNLPHPIPNLNHTGTWNETQSKELRGDFPWSSLTKWEMNLKERYPESNASLHDPDDVHSTHDWTWVKGVASLSDGDENSVEYNFYGLHHIPKGTYRMFGLPDGKRVDIRNIPRLWADDERLANLTRAIVAAELERELKAQQNSLYLVDVRQDGE